MADNSIKSWENVVALSDEMAALVQSGVSLESGLSGVGFDAPHRLRSLGRTLAKDLEQGQSLDEAITARHDQYPDIFRAVIEIGLKSRQLPSALEAISNFARQLLVVRRSLMMSLIYPCIVFAISFFLLNFLILYPIKFLLNMLTYLGVGSNWFFSLLHSLHDHQLEWAIGVPLVVCCLLLASRIFSSNRHVAVIAPSIFSLFPGLGRVTREFEYSLFADMLALCLDQNIPLHQSLQFAADASGNRRLQADAQVLALQIEQGAKLDEGLNSPGITAFPKLLKWMISVGEAEGLLANTMKQTASMYARRAKRRAEWLQTIIPVAFIVFVVGGFTILYALMLFLPFIEIMELLGLPGN